MNNTWSGMQLARLAPIAIALLVGCAGCRDSAAQPSFGELHPVHGTVVKEGKPVTGGVVQFAPIPDKPEFLINSEVGPDGAFDLSTVRTTDTQGERKPGAVAGQYRVTYSPPAGDQIHGFEPPITLTDPVTVEPKANDLKIELSK
jgi:hypothetical protein